MPSATSYAIYRNTQPITSIIGLTPIASGITTPSYEDILTTNGTYYYVAITVAAVGNSGPSNCVGVTTAIPPASSDLVGDESQMFRGALNRHCRYLHFTIRWCGTPVESFACVRNIFVPCGGQRASLRGLPRQQRVLLKRHDWRTLVV